MPEIKHYYYIIIYYYNVKPLNAPSTKMVDGIRGYIGGGIRYNCNNIGGGNSYNCNNIGGGNSYNCNNIGGGNSYNCNNIGGGNSYNCDTFSLGRNWYNTDTTSRPGVNIILHTSLQAYKNVFASYTICYYIW